MKKTFLLFFIIVPFFNYCQSNQILDFKLGFSPQTSYHQTTITSAEYQLSYDGPKEFLETLKSNGIENPTITKSSADMETILKTGKTNTDGTFPVVIEYLKSIDANGKTIIPNGTLIYGKGSLSSLPKLDSIVAKDLDETFKKTVFQIVQSTFSQLALPEKKLKIGESFLHETPLSFPVAGLNIDMIITTTYKLKSIVDKNAFFDIDQIYTAKILDDSKNNINVSGNGTGKLIYDIPNHFSTESNMDMNFKFELKKEEMTMKLNSINNFIQKATISKN